MEVRVGGWMGRGVRFGSRRLVVERSILVAWVATWLSTSRRVLSVVVEVSVAWASKKDMKVIFAGARYDAAVYKSR